MSKIAKREFAPRVGRVDEEEILLGRNGNVVADVDVACLIGEQEPVCPHRQERVISHRHSRAGRAVELIRLIGSRHPPREHRHVGWGVEPDAPSDLGWRHGFGSDCEKNKGGD